MLFFKRSLITTKCHILCNWIVTFFYGTINKINTLSHIIPFSHLKKSFTKKEAYLIVAEVGLPCVMPWWLLNLLLNFVTGGQRRRGLKFSSPNSVKAFAQAESHQHLVMVRASP